MERELFVDGQTPDFSVLQELLCPPCLESEPSKSPIPNPKGVVGPETTAAAAAAAATTGESRFEPFVGMACCVSTPDSKALTFLQESAQLLSQPRAISSTTTAGRPPWQAGGPPLRPKTSHPAVAPRSGSLPGAASLASFAPLDALSLISLHCSSLELEPAAGIAPAEAPEGRPPAARAKDGGDLLRRAPGGKPREAPAPLPPETGAPRHKAEPPAKGRGRRVSRKQPRPRRSCESRDPAFQGVTFQMQLRLCHSSAAGCRLLVRHRYSSGKPRKRSRIPLAKEDDRPGTSEEEDGCLSTHRNKRCASCKTRKTPLWRDAEDGTPLCNACGIRYKKYRMRCFRCWNIPKHGGKPYSHCSSCGGRLHVVTAQQKSGKRCAAS